MCSLCGNTGAENFLIVIGPHVMSVLLTRLKGSIKVIKNKILTKD